MSNAKSKTLNQATADARRDARREKREARQANRRTMRAWFQDRAAAGKERAAIRARKARKAESGLRGVDRVPSWRTTKKGNPLQRQPRKSRQPEPLPESPVGEMGAYRGVTANHADRRARGQRGHQKRPRLRELPGAQARRIERNQKAWTK